MSDPLHYLVTALTNLGVGLVGAVVLCGFLAQQRAARLRYQLDQLMREVRGDGVAEIPAVWEPMGDRLKRWRTTHDEIKADIEKGSDRLVRLNSRKTHEFKMLFGGLTGEFSILQVLYPDAEDSNREPTPAEVAEKIGKLRDSISAWDFFESFKGL